MSATNVVRDTSAADYLNWLRLNTQQQLAAGTAGTNFTPEYIFQFSDSFDITDSVSLTSASVFYIGSAKIGFSVMS